MPKAIAAPKRDLPIHAESYNPPEEYLLDDKKKSLRKWMRKIDHTISNLRNLKL